MKYAPVFGRLGCLAHARAFCEKFFDCYNTVHRHSGIGLHIPASVHDGTATTLRDRRQETLTAAYRAHPARFRHRPPTPPTLPTAAWINDPQRDALVQNP